MSKLNISFKGKQYSIDKSLLAGAISSLEDNLVVLENYQLPYSEGLAYTAHPSLDGVYVSGIGTCTDTVIVLPLVDSNGSAVLGIGPQAFKECGTITDVVIHENMSILGNYAFYNCKKLVNISVSENNPKYTSVDGILYSKDASSGVIDTIVAYPAGRTANSFIIPENVTKIANTAFVTCFNLQNVELPNNITSIGTAAFMYCNLGYITISDSVETIGSQAFAYNGQISSITIGSNVKSIGQEAFISCYTNTIRFNGTTAQWNAITKGVDWNKNVPATYVQCSDGQVTL